MPKVLFLMDKLTTGGAEVYFIKVENHINGIDLYTAAGGGELEQNLKNYDKFTLLSRKNHLKNLISIHRIIRKNKIKIIHANCLRMAIYTILLKVFIPQLKIIYTKHNVTILESKTKKIFSIVINQFIDKVITVCDFEKRNLVNKGVKENKIVTIYNGVDLNQFMFSFRREEQKEFKVGILARLSEEKNHDLFIEIADLLKGYRFNDRKLKFYLAGDGPEREKIHQELKTRQLDDNVKLLGNISQPERFLANINLLLLTSHREVFPMSIIEAMAIGTPIISVDVGGVNEAVSDNKNGYLIDSYSAEKFALKIKEVFQKTELAEEFAQRSRKKVEKEFSLDLMIRRIAEQYRVLNG